VRAADGLNAVHTFKLVLDAVLDGHSVESLPNKKAPAISKANPRTKISFGERIGEQNGISGGSVKVVTGVSQKQCGEHL
jgi:hypothetical protein